MFAKWNGGNVMGIQDGMKGDGNDNFFTKPEIAKQCIDFFYTTCPFCKDNKVLEPSAGSGNFIQYLTNFTALDIFPKAENIIKQDFLKWQPDQTNYVCIGNPPYGYRSQMAKAFINQATKCSIAIGFILPIGMKRYFTYNSVNPNWGIVAQLDLPENSFLFNNQDYTQKTVFQIWLPKTTIKEKGYIDLRSYIKPPEENDFFSLSYLEFNKNHEHTWDKLNLDWDFAMRTSNLKDSPRGTIIKKENWTDADRKSMYQLFFLKDKSKLNQVLQIIQSIDWNTEHDKWYANHYQTTGAALIVKLFNEKLIELS